MATMDVEIEKLKYSPRWCVRRIELLRRRNGWRPQPPRPVPSVPRHYKTGKRSHWLKDHHRRIEDILATAICMYATGPWTSRPDQTARDIEMFNGHIAPIAELYGFKLQMELNAGAVELRGDVNRARSVLLYITSNNRTPETDYLLDTLVLSQIVYPADAEIWKRAWDKKLRHTKRGQHWRSRRDAREQCKLRADAILGPNRGPLYLKLELESACRSVLNHAPDFSEGI
jgi:hypothetical protein